MDEEVKIEGNIDIEKALEEFKIKSVQEELLKPKINQTPKGSKMVEWLVKQGITKDEKQAEYVLLGFVIIAIIISFYLFFGGKHTQQKPSDALLEQMKQIQINKQNNN